MRKPIIAVCLALAAAVAVAPSFAQDAAKKSGPPKAAKGLSESILEQWNGIGKKLVAMAEDFPEDKYDFKATPAERTFAEQLLHAAGANYFLINIANGEKPPAEEDPSRAKYKTKADVVAFVKKSIDDGAAMIKSKGDTGLAGMMVDPFENQQVRIFDWTYGFMEHMGEHYGQLVVYYRVAGLVPPESRPKK
jgi:DinB superfamily